MVLQRGIPLPVWGTAEPGATVKISFSGQTASAVADGHGKWEVKLSPLTASETPSEMTIEEENKIVFLDVLVGDVWICSGQSNMAWPLAQAHNASEAIPKAGNPMIRLFKVSQKIAFAPESDCEGKWTACTPETAPSFSAVGYFFGKEIQETQSIPVGLIGTHVGGTPAQAWTSLPALEANPKLAAYATGFRETKSNLSKLVENYQTTDLARWEAETEAWNKIAAAAKAEGKEPNPPKPPRKPRSPAENFGLASVLYNGMIAPLIPYGIKGVIWYQGEADWGRSEEYATLFPALITDWRSRWNEGDFPFLFVQLAGYARAGSWPILRESQAKTLSLPNTGMALAIDIGEKADIHPKNKFAVGYRLALAARGITYGEKLEFSGPMFESVEINGSQARISFTHADGLKIGSAPAIVLGQEVTPPLDHLVGFEIADSSGNFVEADAVIDGEEVVVSSKSVSTPKAVRYGWAAFPDVNLYNAADLPAVPFSSDRE